MSYRTASPRSTAMGYRVIWNRYGDLLVSYWPVERQLADAGMSQRQIAKEQGASQELQE